MEENCTKFSNSTNFLMEFCLLYHSYKGHSSFHLFLISLSATMAYITFGFCFLVYVGIFYATHRLARALLLNYYGSYLFSRFFSRKHEKARKSQHYGDRIGWIFNTPIIKSRMCSEVININNAPKNGIE